MGKKYYLAICLMATLQFCGDSKNESETITSKPSGTPYTVLVKMLIIREKPKVASRKLGIRKQSETVYVAKIVQGQKKVKFGHGGTLYGKWAQISLSSNKFGFVFSPLIEEKKFSDFECEPPGIEAMKQIDSGVTLFNFCSNGVFEYSEYYECSGQCVQVGCWKVSGKTIKIKSIKSLYNYGVGTPTHCTHSCVYDEYGIRNKFKANAKYEDIKNFLSFEEFAFSGKFVKTNNFDMKKLKPGYDCKRTRFNWEDPLVQESE